MVKVNRVYTRTGDDGTTGLVGGARVGKSDLRVAAYGSVDEANAAVGLAVAEAQRIGGGGALERRLGSELRRIQHDLFDAGADLATREDLKRGEALRIQPGQTSRLEALIDEFNERLAPLNSFVLPGGTPLAAALHLARTVVRRAERDAVALGASGEAVSGEAVRYLNRLSDLLFVLARVANAGGDVLWVPGANR